MTAALPLFVAVPLAGAFVAPLLARRSAANDAPAARVLAVVIGTLLLLGSVLLLGRPAETLAGLLEVRGLGIMRVAHCLSSAPGLVVALHSTRPLPRLPERTTYEVLGVALPRIGLDARAPSACAKIRLALAAERVE